MKVLITHIKIRRSEFGVEVEDEEYNEKENRKLLHEHRYIENETIIVSKNIINETVPGDDPICIQVSLTEMRVFVIPRLNK